MFKRKKRSSRKRPAAHSCAQIWHSSRRSSAHPRCVLWRNQHVPSRRSPAHAAAWLCCRMRDVCNFVEEERPTVCEFESADAVGACVGKRAPFTCPNNSLSKVPSGSAPVLTATSVRLGTQGQAMQRSARRPLSPSRALQSPARLRQRVRCAASAPAQGCMEGAVAMKSMPVAASASARGACGSPPPASACGDVRGTAQSVSFSTDLKADARFPTAFE